jgi:HAD superfamily hydrolase (TIGR01509 family)
MIKGILLDFNGVIIDDEPIQLRAYREILDGEGIELTDEAYFASLGMDDKTFVEAAYERAGKTPETNKVLEITNAKTSRWRDIIAGEMPLFPNTRNFIEKMSGEFALGIVSMAKREEIEHVLETAGLEKFFSVIVSAEQVSHCKPHPECYKIGFRLLDLARTSAGHLPMTHGECLVIEDSPPGIISAKTNGLRTLGVTNTVAAEALRDAGAEAVAANLDDWFPASVRRVFD